MSEDTEKSYGAQDPIDSEKDLFYLIDTLESMIDEAKSVPFSYYCLVNRDEIFTMIRYIREHLPIEIKQARLLLEQNRSIIDEARKLADKTMHEAEMRMMAMIDEHEVTNKAKQKGEKIVENATESARVIRENSLEYARKKLTDLEEKLTEILVTIQKNKKELK